MQEDASMGETRFSRYRFWNSRIGEIRLFVLWGLGEAFFEAF